MSETVAAFSEEDKTLLAVLGKVAASRGGAALGNRRMLLGLLRDHAPDRARAIRILMAAFDADTVTRLRDGPAEADALEREARALSSDAGLRDDLASWAVQMWAAALASRGSAGALPAGVLQDAAPVASAPPPVPQPFAPKATAEDMTWSTPAAPAPTAPPAAPPTSPPADPPKATAEDMTWSTPAAPPPATAASSPPVVPPVETAEGMTSSTPAPLSNPSLPQAATPSVTAEDLTWSTPAAPPRPETPDVAATAPNPPQPPGTRFAVSGRAGRILRNSSVVVVALVMLITILNRFGLFSDSPSDSPAPTSEPAAAPEPFVPTHGGGRATTVGKSADGVPIVLGSNSTDVNDWPIVPGAAHDDGNPRSWRFSTGVRFADGRLFVYQSAFLMNPDFKRGLSSVAAANLSTATGNNPVSVSQNAEANRSLDASGIYRLDSVYANWQSDGAAAPKICMVMTLEKTPARFEPQVFCAVAYVNGACSNQYLSCGFFH